MTKQWDISWACISPGVQGKPVMDTKYRCVMVDAPFKCHTEVGQVWIPRLTQKQREIFRNYLNVQNKERESMTKIEIYQGKNKEWRWRMKRAGRIVADSGEGYQRRAACKRTLLRLIASFQAGKFTTPA